jgi:hypothetical protein
MQSWPRAPNAAALSRLAVARPLKRERHVATAIHLKDLPAAQLNTYATDAPEDGWCLCGTFPCLAMVVIARAALPMSTVEHTASEGRRHAYTNVLHELVYALMGIMGDVFVDARPKVVSGEVLHPNKSLFHVTTEASWLSDADRVEIDAILELGFHFAEIDRFVKGNQQPLDASSVQGAWQGLAMGLEGDAPGALGAIAPVPKRRLNMHHATFKIHTTPHTPQLLLPKR